jgi:hypothetical protein
MAVHDRLDDARLVLQHDQPELHAELETAHPLPCPPFQHCDDRLQSAPNRLPAIAVAEFDSEDEAALARFQITREVRADGATRRYFDGAEEITLAATSDDGSPSKAAAYLQVR